MEINTFRENEFNNHYTKWHNDIKYSSDINEILNHPEFKAIIDMGENAVPFIYKTIKEKPSFIVFALPYICKNKPYFKNTYSVNKVCEAWIKHLKETRNYD